MLAHHVALGGRSETARSRRTERLCLLAVRANGVSKDGDAPALPRVEAGANTGDVDDPGSRHHSEIVAGVHVVPILPVFQGPTCPRPVLTGLAPAVKR